ncbi:MAG: membrane protein insertion efficiency factor YidD [Syntrophomonadaceae bacterium]
MDILHAFSNFENNAMRIFVIICLILFASALSHAQETDWQRWGKSEIKYAAVPEKQSSSGESKSFGNLLLGTSHSLYNFVISDLDGDNCPFEPTCSNFFIQSVRATNIFQGSLMFFDRFTRDMNILKINHYPVTADRRRFTDPVMNYTLRPEKIKYLPPKSIKN